MVVWWSLRRSESHDGLNFQDFLECLVDLISWPKCPRVTDRSKTATAVASCRTG